MDLLLEQSLFRSAYWFKEPERGVVLAVHHPANRRLVFFIHGFLGHHLQTWGELPVLILNDRHFADVDFCFLGYKGSVASISTLGMYFQQVITRASAGQEPFPRVYEEFLVAAHSLGGIGLRSGLLDLSRLDPSLLSRVSACVLAAPALFGSKLADVGEWTSHLLRDSLLFLTPVLADLSNLTDEVKKVREGFDLLMRRLGKDHKPRSDIRWAMYDRIVSPRRVGYAPPPPDTQSTEAYTHCSIVKPSDQTHPFYVALKKLVR